MIKDVTVGTWTKKPAAPLAFRKKRVVSTNVPLMNAEELESLASRQPVLSLDGVLKQVRKSLGRTHPTK